MNGAIPYHKIRERSAPEGITAGILSQERQDRLQPLLCRTAHQVNNLLMRIQGYTSLMLMDVKAGQAGFERLKHIEKHIDCGAVLTSQLLACAGRGVYADPVNIPPLLLKAQAAGNTARDAYDVRSRLFIVANENGKMRPGLLGICRDLNLKIAGLFGGIENVITSGRQSRIEKHYNDKVRRVTGEGTSITREATAFLEPFRGRTAHRRFLHPHRDFVHLYRRPVTDDI